jgi:hypothetical protein
MKDNWWGGDATRPHAAAAHKGQHDTSTHVRVPSADGVDRARRAPVARGAPGRLFAATADAPGPTARHFLPIMPATTTAAHPAAAGRRRPARAGARLPAHTRARAARCMVPPFTQRQNYPT